MVFSGSGRHRRPTQADRAVAAASVMGVGLALPLLTAAGAHAVPATSWDTVAQCMSGGNWTANDGDGGYGGLQLTLRDWKTYGGDQYAAQPSHATKDQQIAIAEKLLADQGTVRWPGCATVLTTAPVTPPTTAPSTPATPVTPPTTAPVTPPATPVTPAVPATPAPTAPTAPVTTPAAPTTPATPAMPADPAAPPAASAPATTPPSTPVTPVTPPVTAPAAPQIPAAPAVPTPGDYTVVEGDTLSGISNTYHLGGWQHVYAQNLGTVGADPDLIHPGQVLHLS
ncbi:transglycosylase family protein [Kitasatospora sp. NPDC002227]|uniref:LysM peptidoglycan-binding domain-containing protein n=1 Tax=Kitasatospora sp. NPDC002227 TaxID=3154773 RepID=UPI003328345A